MSYTRYGSETFCVFVRRKNNHEEVISGDYLENNEKTGVKWKRNLKFQKACKYSKRKIFKEWFNQSYCTILLPISLPSSKAITHKTNGQSFFVWFSIKSLICNTPKCDFYSTLWRKLMNPLLWRQRRLVAKESPFISHSDKRPTTMAAATTFAPVAMNIWDTKINGLYRKILSLSPPHHLNGEFIPLRAAFTAEMK